MLWLWEKLTQIKCVQFFVCFFCKKEEKLLQFNCKWDEWKVSSKSDSMRWRMDVRWLNTEERRSRTEDWRSNTEAWNSNLKNPKLIKCHSGKACWCWREKRRRRKMEDGCEKRRETGDRRRKMDVGCRRSEGKKDQRRKTVGRIPKLRDTRCLRKEGKKLEVGWSNIQGLKHKTHLPLWAVGYV